MVREPVVQRIAGFGAAVLLVALAFTLIELRSTTAGAYRIEAELGRAGAGLSRGSIVKVRGVDVGRVLEVTLERDGNATALVELQPDARLPASSRPVVSAKTFLGQKQLELAPPEGPLTPPWLEDGDVVRMAAGEEVVEVNAVVDQIGELFADVDRDALAGLVEALGEFDEADAELFGRGIDVGAELAEFAERTGPQQLARLRDATAAFAALEAAAPELDRAARAVPGAARPLVEGHADLVETLDRAGEFGGVLDDLLTVEEPRLRALLAVSDQIGAVVDPRLHHLGEMVYGISRYAMMFGQQGPQLTDGSEAANFRIFIGEAGMLGELCEQLPDVLAELAPACTRPRS